METKKEKYSQKEYCTRCWEKPASTVYGICNDCDHEYQREWDKD